MKSSRNYPVYTVNKHAEGLLVGGHPWVYENDIQSSPEAEPENGTLVDVVSTKGAYLGTGFLSLKSKIRVPSPATPTTPLMPLSGSAVSNTPGPTARPCWSPPT